MNDSEGEYDELEDDFIFAANDGLPALVAQPPVEELDDEGANEGVEIVKDEMEERLKGLREMMKQHAHLLSDNKEDFLKEQDQMDEQFEQLIEDYDDIGEGQDEEIEEQDDAQAILADAVDEYIESQKEGRREGRDLYHEFASKEPVPELEKV